jgi:peroxiredoxin
MNLRSMSMMAAAVGALTLATGAHAAADGAPATTTAPTTSTKIADFTLPDQNQQSHELYKLADASAIVLVTQGDGCPIVRNLATALRALQAKYEPKGVKFMMLNPNLQDNSADVIQEAKDYGYNLPILMDSKQVVGERLGVVRTAEVFVINPKTWKIIYHGPVDDRLSYGLQKDVADHPWADEAIQAAIDGKTVPYTEGELQGCLINFPNRDARTAQGTVGQTQR